MVSVVHRSNPESRLVGARTITRTIKKYSNRRLYDTDLSRYITLEELTATIRQGVDVRIVDAKSGEDLTQATLVQLIVEGDTAAFLPVPLLLQLVRTPADALGEFFANYVSNALQMYLKARQGVQHVAPYFPFANIPLHAADAVLRMFAGGAAPTGAPSPASASAAPAPDPDAPATTADVAELRRELQLLKRDLLRGTTGGAAPDAGSPDESDADG